jgi:hypothetical protein
MATKGVTQATTVSEVTVAEMRTNSAVEDAAGRSARTGAKSVKTPHYFASSESFL